MFRASNDATLLLVLGLLALFVLLGRATPAGAMPYAFVEGREAVNFGDGRSPEQVVKAIALRCYGDEKYWFHIWQANRAVLIRSVQQGVQLGQTIPLEIPGLVSQDVNGIVPATTRGSRGTTGETAGGVAAGANGTLVALLGTTADASTTPQRTSAGTGTATGSGTTRTLTNAQLAPLQSATSLQAALQLLAQLLCGDGSQASQLWATNRQTLRSWWTAGGATNPSAGNLTLTVPGAAGTSGTGTTAAATAASPLRQRIVQTALGYQGVPYRWGGQSRRSVDCSGLVYAVFRENGIGMPRSTSGLIHCGTAVSPSNLAPGDLVFFNGGGHVGIYVGDGQYIHSPYTGTVVQVSTLDARSDLYACRRVL